MTLWARIHGLALGIPLVVLAFLCVSSMGRVGETWRPRWLPLESKSWLWFGLLFLAWATPLSGMWVMYFRPQVWREGGEWATWALPWMASWGMMVPVLATACVYLNYRLYAGRRDQGGGQALVIASRLLMFATLAVVLMVALLGALSTSGVSSSWFLE